MSVSTQQHDQDREEHRLDRGTRREEPLVVVCPFCHSTDTERFALFGSRLSADHYTCNSCHTAFERMRYTKE